MNQSTRTFLQLSESTEEIPTQPDFQSEVWGLRDNEFGDDHCSEAMPTLAESFNLMDLPKEIRLLVYEYAAVPIRVKRGRMGMSHFPSHWIKAYITWYSERVMIDLLYVSRQIAHEASEIFKRSFRNSKGCYREVIVENPPPELTADSLRDILDCMNNNLDMFYQEHEPRLSDIDRLLYVLGNDGTNKDDEQISSFDS